MDINTWLVYTLAMLILTAAPGPSVLLCVSKSVGGGFKTAFYAAVGSTVAIVGIITLSFTGLGLVLATSEVAFTTVKWIGVAYLIYLGVRALMSSSTAVETGKVAADESVSRGSHFLSGFLVGASNPKAIVFFSALFPQFIDQTGSMYFQYLVFVLTFIVFEMSWLLTYALFGHKTSHWWRQSDRLDWFNKATGGLFIGAGMLLAASSRASARVN